MGLLSLPKVSRKLQRTLKNLRVSFLCFLLTFLVLRNTIGAGKFGTPAQDFEEIRLHLRNVGLHRRHFRVLAEAVEEEKSRLLTLKDKQRSAIHGELDEGEGLQSNVLSLEEIAGRKLHEKDLYLSEITKENNAPLSFLKEMQGSAALSTRDVIRRNAPLLAIGKGMEGFRGDVQRKLRKALAHGQPDVLVVLGAHTSGCERSADEHLLLKSLKNKVDYSTLHGFEVATVFGGLDPEAPEPISRLSLLQRTMVNNPEVEWLWWMPHEAVIITDMTFELPLHTFMEFNLVLFGSVGASYHQENMLINLKTDTFLIRNCQWSAELLERSVKIGSLEVISPDMVTELELKVDDASVHHLFFNQQGKASRGMIHVEDSVMLRGYWRDLVLNFEDSKLHLHAGVSDKRVPFVTDFLGCKLGCEPGTEVGTCSKQIEAVLLSVEKEFGFKTESLASS